LTDQKLPLSGKAAKGLRVATPTKLAINKRRSIMQILESVLPYERLMGYSATAKLFVIMFKDEFFPVGPFETWQAADEYGMRVVEPKLCKGCNEWKIRPLQPITAATRRL
jgi:hypothetical protein